VSTKSLEIARTKWEVLQGTLITQQKFRHTSFASGKLPSLRGIALILRQHGMLLLDGGAHHLPRGELSS